MGKSKLFDYSKEELQRIFDESCSYADVLEKCGMSRHGSNYKTIKKVINEYEIDLEKISENRGIKNKEDLSKSRKVIPLEDVLSGKVKYKGTKLLKKLLSEGIKEHKCERCGNDTWQGMPIPLNLHHKDGEHDNNELSNLEVLCPNCHALTDTYAGKNKKFDECISEDDEKIPNKARKGITEDGQRLYDGYGNYKILCPECKINFMGKESVMCAECRSLQRITPKIERDDLYALIKKHKSAAKVAELTGYNRKTISRWFKYYVNQDNKNR